MVSPAPHDVLPPFPGDWQPAELSNKDLDELDERLSERQYRGYVGDIASAAQRYFVSDEHDAPDDITIVCSEIGIPPSILSSHSPISSTIATIAHELRHIELRKLADHQPGHRVLLLPSGVLPPPTDLLMLPIMHSLRFRPRVRRHGFSYDVGFVALSRNAPMIAGFVNPYENGNGLLTYAALDVATLVGPGHARRLGGETGSSQFKMHPTLNEPYL